MDDEGFKRLNYAYWSVFSTKEGQMVLDDLWFIVKRTSLDARNIEPNKAVFRLAQEQLLETIERKIETHERDS